MNRLDKQKEKNLQAKSKILHNKRFFSGREIQNEDYIYFGFLKNMNHLQLILIHEEELNSIYKLSSFDEQNSLIPTIEKV